MKPSILGHLLLGVAVLTADTTPDESRDAVRLPDPATIRFVPPPPPKEVPAMAVKDSTTADFGTHRVTILRGEPSTLPDIPEPPRPVEPDPEAVAKHTESIQLLFVSGSTYDNSLSRVEIWNPETRTRHTAWCGWDISLVAPFHEIVHQGTPRFLLMGIGPGVAGDEHPDVEPGFILVPDGDEFTASVLTSLRDAHDANLPKLLEIKAARERYRLDAATWRAANPPRPQDHTIWLKPHRGSRYLENRTGHKQEGAP